jgi:hypothetical protein
MIVFHCLRDHTVPTIVSHLPTLISLVRYQRASEGCDRHENEGDNDTQDRHSQIPTCTYTHSEEKVAMVDGGRKVQMPISRRSHSRLTAAPSGHGNLPAVQSMHAEVPPATVYVPAEGEGK